MRRGNLVTPSRYALAADVQPSRSAGSSTSQVVLGRHLLSLLCRFSKLSRDERPDGSLPTFAWGDVAHRSTPIGLITRPPSLSPSSSTRCAVPVPCSSDTTRSGTQRAYPVDHCGVARQSGWGQAPGGAKDVAACRHLRQSAPRTFWSRPPASWAVSNSREGYALHICSTLWRFPGPLLP